MKKVLSGNEAIARGAWEAGCHFAAAYPGTPSTEILENVAHYKEINSQWSVNEKVAFEAACGASIGGARALCAQKHVGLNVAADPLFTMSYLGVHGGFVIITADDPGMHSSQNEQDNRHYARAAKLPLLEPADSQEAKDMVIEGFKISEKFNTPVLIRVTTRICHSKSVVECFDREEIEVKKFEKNQRFLCLPSAARKLHVKVEQRSLDIAEYGNSYKWNKAEYNDTSVGIITSGISYNYTKEVMPDASFLKLTLSWPQPEKLIREFADKVDKILIIEENEPFIENQVKALGITCEGKKYFDIKGELSPERIQEGLSVALPERIQKPEMVEIPEGIEPAVRPPVLCPGCPHRGVFRALGKLKVFVSGDIGCYTLGAFAPLNALHSCLCMGGGVTVAEGIEKAQGNHTKVVGMVGDSTFVHSGITGLIDMVYNKSKGTIIIVDNSITAMTGHQQNPTTAKTLQMEETHQLDIEAVCKAVGVKHVKVVDPFDLKATEDVLKEEINRGELSVVITRRPCILILKDRVPEKYLKWDNEACKACGMCLKIGCPAMEKQPDNEKQPKINMALCVHCGMCAQMCKFDSLTMNKKED